MRAVAAACVLVVTSLLGMSGASAAEPEPVWLCKPGMVDDPCEIELDTTERRLDGTARVYTPDRAPQDQRPVDCFYVYPTVSNQLGINATKAKDPELYSIAKYQAARFSTQCRMFVPVYRQAPLAGVATLALAVPKAYADVRAAWRSYLANDNDGRGVVLIGHSQGTLMLRKLIRQEIDPDPAARERLVGAVLMGGNVTVAKGKTTGGDFRNIPLCSSQGQAGCVVAYSTYSRTPPILLPFFGNSLLDPISLAINHRTGLGYSVACTDPGPLSGSTEPFGVTIPSEPFAPGLIRNGIKVTANGPVPTADTTWVTSADRAQGSCRTVGGARIYVHTPTPGSRTLREFPPTWGTHLVDMNLGLERLVKIVELQTRTWLAQR